MGEVPAGAALRRGGAKAGNDVWVSGNVGDAALAVAHRYGKLVLDAADYHEAVMRLYEPTPRVTLGQALRGLATAAIDISDGLLARPRRTSAGSRAWARPWTSPRCRSPRSARKHINSDEGRDGDPRRRRRLRAVLHRARRTRATASRTSPTSWTSRSRASARSQRGKGVSLLGADGKPVKIDGTRIRSLQGRLTRASSSRTRRISSPWVSARDWRRARPAPSARSWAGRSTGRSRRSSPPLVIAFLAVPLFFLGVWACDKTGRDLGRGRPRRDGVGRDRGLPAARGAVLRELSACSSWPSASSASSISGSPFPSANSSAS